MTKNCEMIDLVDEIAELRLKTLQLSSQAADLLLKELFSQCDEKECRDALIIINRRRAELGLSPLTRDSLVCKSDFKKVCQETIMEWAFLRIVEKF